MTGGILGFLVFAIMIPLVVNEAGDLARSLARCLLRWGARRIGRADQAQRYEEEWLADLERVPGNLTKLGYACGVVIRSVPRLRAQFRQGPRGARLPGILPGRVMDAIGEQLAGSLEIGASWARICGPGLSSAPVPWDCSRPRRWLAGRDLPGLYEAGR